MVSASLLALSGAGAVAQDDEDGGFALEEIVVTAQKREQSAQDVGLSVTALSGNMMQERGIDNVVKIQDSTPNLRIKQTFGSGIPQYAIRGIGELADSSALSSSPIAVHVNEVPMPYPMTSMNLLFDLAQVEVLRGPQGDLFGLNTTGGTINYITRKPTDEFEGQLLMEYGSYERYKVEGYISGALSDTVRARLAFSRNDRNKGWQTNQRSGERLGEMEKTGVRLSFNFAPSDTFEADLEMHYTRDDSDATGARNRKNYLSAPDTLSLLLGGVQIGQEHIARGFYETDWSDANTFLSDGTKPFIDHEGYGGSLVMNWDMDGVVLTSVTGYEDYKRDEYLDWDGTAFNDSDQRFISDLWTFSQELRLASDTDSEFQWMIGANYAKDRMNNLTLFDIFHNPFFPATGGQDMTQKREVKAAFGHFEYDVSEKLQLVAGLRYTDETRNALNIGTALYADQAAGAVDWLEAFGLLPAGTGDALGIDPAHGFIQQASGLMVALFGTGDVLVPSNNIDVPGSQLTGADFTCFDLAGPCTEGYLDNASMPSSDWSGKIGVNYHASDDWLVFANISRGTKSGGFLETAASSHASFRPATTEKLTAFEVGTKGSFLEGRGRLNATAFYYDYKDMQVAGTVVDPFFGPLGALVNVPKSNMKGFEVEAILAVTQYLEVGTNVGLSKGKFKDYTNGVDGAAVRSNYSACLASGAPDCVYENVPQDNSGEGFTFPEWQLSGYVNYERPIGDYTGRIVLDFSHESKTTSLATWREEGPNGNEHTFNLPGYWLFNARTSLASDEGWEVTLFADNLFKQKYLTSYAQFDEAVVQTVGMPRTYGVRVRFDF